MPVTITVGLIAARMKPPVSARAIGMPKQPAPGAASETVDPVALSSSAATQRVAGMTCMG